MKFTDGTIGALTVPDGKSEIICFDDDFPGFGVRLRRGGSRRFIFQYRDKAGANRRITIKAPTVKVARAVAEKEAARLTLDIDPAQEREAAQGVAGDTFQRCMERYLANPLSGRRRKPRDSTLREIRRHLEVNLAPLHRLHIKKIDRRRVAEELRRITEERGPVQANRTRTSLHAFYRWCIGEGYADVNIVTETNQNVEEARERVLSDSELTTVWRSLPETGDDYADIIRLLILTACRRDEISELRWPEVNDLENPEKATITLPGSRTKNHRPHLVPLSPPASAILQARPRNGRELVFGQGAGGFGGWNRAKKRLDSEARLNQPWTQHDLRRTASTGLGRLGVQPHIIECVLNHVGGFKKGVAGVYNRHPYEDEMRQALNKWGEHVSSLTKITDEKH